MMKFRFQTDRSRYGKRHVPGEMNKTESRYADLLYARKLAGEIVDFSFEPITLKLAEGCRFTVDFTVLLPDGTMEFVDVKGGGPVADDALVKIKAAADKFWQFTFVQEKERTKKAGGGFERREF